MAACNDAPQFYALVNQACAPDPGSPACQRVVSEGVDTFGTSCLELPIVEGVSRFPPFADYVCRRATGRLASQCGRRTAAPASSESGTGSAEGPGVGYGAAATIAGSSAAVGGLAGALRSARRRATLPPEMSAEDKCAVDWIMCIDTNELTLDRIRGKGNQKIKNPFGGERMFAEVPTYEQWVDALVEAKGDASAQQELENYKTLIEAAQQKIDTPGQEFSLLNTGEVSTALSEKIMNEYSSVSTSLASDHFKALHGDVISTAQAESSRIKRERGKRRVQELQSALGESLVR